MPDCIDFFKPACDTGLCAALCELFDLTITVTVIVSPVSISHWGLEVKNSAFCLENSVQPFG